MKVLVTGANGLIGSNLVRVLIEEGAEVRALVRPGSDPGSLRGLPVETVYGDLTSPDPSWTRAADGADLIFHTAVRFTYDGRAAHGLEQIALSGTERVLGAAARAGVKRTVVTSSSVVFGYGLAPGVRDERSGLASPADEPAYVAAKIKQDQHALELAEGLGTDLVLVCPTMSVGGHGSRLGPSNAMVVAYLNDALRSTYPGGCNVVSAIDVARGHLQAADLGKPGEHYILGSENLEWREVHGLVAELCGVSPPQVHLNRTLSYLASTAEEVRARLAHRPALATRDQAEMVGRYYWYSHEKASRLGYQPRPARTALAEAISDLAMGPHVSRQVRSTLRLHPDVYRARRDRAEAERRVSTGTGRAT